MSTEVPLALNTVLIGVPHHLHVGEWSVKVELQCLVAFYACGCLLLEAGRALPTTPLAGTTLVN